MQDNLGLIGKFYIKNVSTGEERFVDNTVVTVGKSQVAGLISVDVNVGSAFGYMAIGIGSATITAADVLLGSEAYKVDTADSRTTTTTTNDTAVFIGSFTADATKSINEAGLFNKSGLNLGSMLSRTCFAALNVETGNYINATWNVKVA